MKQTFFRLSDILQMSINGDGSLSLYGREQRSGVFKKFDTWKPGEKQTQVPNFRQSAEAHLEIMKLLSTGGVLRVTLDEATILRPFSDPKPVNETHLRALLEASCLEPFGYSDSVWIYRLDWRWRK